MQFHFFLKTIVSCVFAFFGSIGILSTARAFPLSWVGEREELNNASLPTPVEPNLCDKLLESPILIVCVIVVVFLTALVSTLIVKKRKKNRSPFSDDTEHNETPKTNRKKKGSFNSDMIFNVGILHHIGQRDEQQDSFCLSDINNKNSIRDKGIMAVVADGMGGLEGGSIISQLVADTFNNRYKQTNNFEPENFLYETAQESENIVDDYKKRTGINGGSTLVAIIIKAGELHTLSVGDSRIYLLRQGKLKKINQEHTFGAYLKEKADRGEVNPEEPYINSKRDALTAFIGIGNFRKVYRGEPIPLFQGDKILLCSDGVFNALNDEAIIATLTGDAFVAAEKMEKAILAQYIPTQDNFTGIILEYVK